MVEVPLQLLQHNSVQIVKISAGYGQLRMCDPALTLINLIFALTNFSAHLSKIIRELFAGRLKSIRSINYMPEQEASRGK